MQVTSHDTLEKKECFAGTGREATAILVYVIGEQGLIKRASLRILSVVVSILYI